MNRPPNTCPNCKNTTTTTRENYHYTASGLKNVTLVDIDMRRCSACGWSAAVIPNVDDLHRVLAGMIIEKPSRLLGSELRFLRKYLAESGSAFASQLGVAPETLSRWENEKESVSPVADRLARLYVVVGQPRDSYPEAVVEKIKEVSRDVDNSPIPLGVRTKDHSWERTTLTT